MAEFLVSKKWSELKQMSFEEIAKLPCIEIVSDNGESKEKYGVFLMVPSTDYIQALCDARGQLSNSILPVDEVVVQPVAEAVINVPRVRRKKRPYHKRVKVEVC